MGQYFFDPKNRFSKKHSKMSFATVNAYIQDMTTIVTKSPTAAQSLSIGVTGATDWTNPSNVFASDSQYAVNAITGSGTANYLYASNFAANIPASAVIEGFQVTVKRHCNGSVQDYFVGLIYGSLLQTSPGKQLTGDWPSIDGNATYGGSTDLWNRSWTVSEVNDPNFGVVISVVGNPLDIAYIDQIQITIFYHQNISINGTGGSYGAGSARVTNRYNQTTTPAYGVNLGNSGLITINPDILAAGVLGDGTATISEAVAVSGGAGIDGSADVFTIFTDTLDPTEFSFNCLGSKNVPPDYSNNFSANCRLRVDTTNNILHWHIEHNVPGLDAARFRGPATETTPTAPTLIAIDGTEPLTSPVDGSSPITPTQKAQILAGQWFLFLRRDARIVGDPVIRLRSQIFNENLNASGTAPDTHTITESMNGGNDVGGDAGIKATYLTTDSPSGAIDGGDAVVAFSVAVGGGSVVGGTADQYQIFNMVVGSGGVGGDGSSAMNVNYSVAIDPSGVLSDGSGIIGIQPSIGGGAGCDGHVQELKLALPAISGGAYVSGSYTLQQTYAAQPSQGGLSTGSKTRARVEYIKHLVKQNISVCKSLVTPNICNTPIDTKVRIIDPVGTVTPETTPSQFRIRHDPGWCDMNETCNGGHVPKIVAKRQGIYMPPKKGSALPVPTDQLATMT